MGREAQLADPASADRSDNWPHQSPDRRAVRLAGHHPVGAVFDRAERAGTRTLRDLTVGRREPCPNCLFGFRSAAPQRSVPKPHSRIANGSSKMLVAVRCPGVSALARAEVARALLSLGPSAAQHGDEVLARIDLVRITDAVLRAAGTLMPAEL